MPSAASSRRVPILPMTARGLVYEAGGRRLIDELDLDVAAGTLTAILGPNGAGKSLLLRLLHGLIAPTAGRVLFAGRLVDAAIRRRQAMVFQKPVLLRRSVSANIDYALRLTGPSATPDRERRRELLTLGNLTHLAETPARRLSGGEQQRLALVRALALEPDILFLDEPTASLDPAASLAVERLIRTAHGTGTTIVLVTHDRAQAQRLADKVVLLHRGRVAEQAATASFFAAPESEAGQAFLAGRFML